MRTSGALLSLVALLVAAPCPAAAGSVRAEAPASGAGPALSSESIGSTALQADLRFAVATIEQQHPDLAHSVSRATFERAVARVARQLVRPMDQAQAWAAFATLNPTLADGHLFIGLPNWRAMAADTIARGTGFFPFEVTVPTHGYPVIKAALGGMATPLAGRRIVRIDGRDARRVARSLLARAHGDTPGFRAALASQRWWLFYAKLYGTPESFDLVTQGTDKRRERVLSSRTLPDIVQRDAGFERLFQCDVGPDAEARLMVASFAWDDKDRFLKFTRDCFARIKAAATLRLVIDVSANGGGDDDYWKDGILRYIATRPYRQGSSYVKRARSGEIAHGMIEADTLPVRDEPLHFDGALSVLIGPSTYSSAVLFSNVVKDYGFGRLIGQGGFARTAQSGGVRNVTLPHSGLILSFPRFVLAPPSGGRAPFYLEPDSAR